MTAFAVVYIQLTASQVGAKYQKRGLMIMIKIGNLCLVILIEGGPQYTYVTKNRLEMLKVFRTTEDVLTIMKDLERGGYVSSEKVGSGYFWRLTDSGMLKAKQVK